MYFSERILGKNNPYLMESIVNLGHSYADSYNYTPCLKLWSYAMNIRKINQFNIYDDLMRFSKVNMIIYHRKKIVNIIKH